ncbi:redoxin [Prosthecochloris sp. GSB1]|nr:redoxin [Prosthecochloris sp. GSB1]
MKPFRLFGVVCLSFVMLACQPEKAETARPEAATADNAVSAPVFTARTLDGETFSTAELEGKAYIVNFFASWCPPCRMEIPDMVELQKQFEARGFTFIGIAVNEQDDRIRSFVEESGINYPVIVDQNDELGSLYRPFDAAYNLRSIPTSFVVGSDGRIVSVLVGMQSHEAFSKAIQQAIGAGK